MSGGPSQQDRGLLSRLNALKKSTIDLDEKQLSVSHSHPTSLKTDIDPLLGHAFHADIATRFRALRGTNGSVQSPPPKAKSGRRGDAQESEIGDDDKTAEELLAELGPDEEWLVGKSEEDQVRDLLKEAQDALKDTAQSERHAEEPDTEAGTSAPGPTPPAKGSARISDIDLSVFQLEPESDSDGALEQKPISHTELKDSLDREADEYLERIMDEIRHEKPGQHSDGGDDGLHLGDYEEAETTKTIPSSPTRAFPSKEPPRPSPTTPAGTTSTTEDPNLSDLFTRFSSLSLSHSHSLPSVPTTAPKPHPPPPATKTKTSPTSYTDAEIDTWCIICNDDATLRCIGCDGDLYCRNCWMEGHRGWEERRHKAMVYNSAGGLDDEKKERRQVCGAGGGIAMS